MNVAPDLGDDGDMGEVVDMSPPPPEEVRYGLSIETLDESTPLSLSAPALVAHPTTGAVILHGGYDKENEVEVGSAWRWENKQWRAIDVSLPSESGHGLAYLPEHARFGIFGNNPDTGWLLWDGEADTSPLTTPCNSGCPLGRNGHALAYHEASEKLMLYGGIGGSSSSPFDALRGDTWTLQGTQWAGVTSEKTPPARSFAAAGYDPVHEVIWMFGGLSEDDYPLDDLWMFDGEAWTEVQPFDVNTLLDPAPGKPPGRLGATFTWHPGIQRMVLIGGSRRRYDLGCCEPWEDFGGWTWDGETWKRLEVPDGTPRNTWSSHHAAVYDPATEAILTVGHNDFFARTTHILRIEQVE